MTLRHLILGLAGASLAILLYLLWSWQPERQVERRFGQLLTALEKRNPKKLSALISPGYSDEWGSSRADIVRLSDEVFRHFFWVAIAPVEPRVTRTEAGVEIESRFQLQGNGTGIAQTILSRANELKTPFVLVWRKESGKPWDWKLASLRQSEINLETISWE